MVGCRWTSLNWKVVAETGLNRRRRPFQGLQNYYLQQLTPRGETAKYLQGRVRQVVSGWTIRARIQGVHCGQFLVNVNFISTQPQNTFLPLSLKTQSADTIDIEPFKDSPDIANIESLIEETIMHCYSANKDPELTDWLKWAFESSSYSAPLPKYISYLVMCGKLGSGQDQGHNQKRLHSTLNYLSPVEYEQERVKVAA